MRKFLSVLALCLGSTVCQEGSGEGSGLEDEDPCPPVLDVIFLLDSSGSIEEIYQEHTRWTIELSDSLPISQEAVRLATIQYAGYPLTEFALNESSSSEEVIKKLKHIAFQSGVTRTGYALRKAESELFRPDRGGRVDGHKVIVLFTDGLSIDDPLKASEHLRTERGVHIYVVSVASDGFVPEMRKIAGNETFTFGPSELARLREVLLREVEDARVCRDGGTPPPATEEPLVTQAAVTLPISEETPKQSSSLENNSIVDEKQESKRALPTAATQHVASRNIKIQNTTKTTKKPTTTRSTTRRTTTRKTTPAPTKTPKQSPQKVKKIRKVWRRKSTTTNSTSTTSTTVTTTPTTTTKKTSTTRRHKILKVVKKQRTSTTAPRTGKTTGPGSTHRQQLESDEVTRSKPFDVDTKRNTRRFSTTTTVKTTSSEHSTTPATTGTTTADTSTHSTTTPLLTTTNAKTSKSTKRTTPFATTPRQRNLKRLFGVRNFVVDEKERCAFDVLFVVDGSGSVISAYDQQKEFLQDLLSNIDVSQQSNRVAMLQFAGAKVQKTEWSFDRFNESEQLMKAFGDVRYFTGTTYIGAALKSAKKLLEGRRSDAETIVVLLSDGFSQDDPQPYAREILSLPNVDFFVASVADLNNTEMLNQLTEDPERVFVGTEVVVLKDKLIERFKCRS